jgi:hypothetical protein
MWVPMVEGLGAHNLEINIELLDCGSKPYISKKV